MPTEWYFNRNGETHGPFNSKQIKNLAASGELTRTDLIAKAGELWREAKLLKGLFPEQAKEGRDLAPATHPIPNTVDEFNQQLQVVVDQYASVMKDMADQMERTHCAMVDMYNRYIADGLLESINMLPATPSGRGIYKARLFGALFVAVAVESISESEEWASHFITLASVIALGSDGAPALSPSEAKTFSHRYIQLVMSSIDDAMNAGPFLPGTDRPEHRGLAEHLHDALSESIGVENYETDVWQKFEVTIQMNAAMSLHHMFRLMADN